MSRKNHLSNQKITALYCRISLDDGSQNESMSISNQKLLLKDYAEKNGMPRYEYYVDDGYTGRNFNRPSFKRLIADIEAGKIGCVITKDLSRLGRNYIEAGSYIEIFFPKHNVRYIAVTDGVDSLTRQEMDITPFKNILNDMYSRDISKKVLAGRMTRSRQGKFCGGQPPLGLMRDPEEKGHLILDPDTAPTIRKIFDLALNGWGCMRIAKQLMEDKIPITRVKSNTECDVNYYSWGSARISHILRNPFYKGAHLVCRTHQKGIRSNTYDIIPREEWEVLEGCHEAIVSPEDWEKVQELIDRRPPIMEGNACPFYNLFHGIIYCATCGKSMQVRYEKVGRTGKNRFTGEEREPIDKAYYICQTYNRLGKNACTSHKVEARDLLYGDNISEKCGKGRDWRGQVWKRPDFRRVCGGTAPEQGRDVAVILRKTASAAVGAFFAPRKAPGGPTNGVAGNDAQTYESPQKRRRQAISGGLWYKMSRMASSRKSQQQTLEDEPPGP